MSINVKDIIGWDVPVWSEVIPFWERHLPHTVRQLKVLEIAANKGGLSLYFADKGCEVTCSDIQDPELRAKALHSSYSYPIPISYQSINALEMPFTENSFDVVVFKSFLGYLTNDKQVDAINEIHRILKPGGMLLFAENLTGSGFHRWMRKRFVPWGKDWNYVSIGEVIELVRVFDSFEYKTNGFLSIFIRNKVGKQIIAPVDKLISKIVPRNFNYVLFGVAKKKV